MEGIEQDFYRIITEKVLELTAQVAKYIEAESLNFSMDKVETKNINDFVSYIDKEAEKLLVKGLSKIVPESGFITEEGTTDQANGQDYCWIIDPLDGTTNFIHGSTPYAISVGLTYIGEPVVGVIHEITRKEAFYAWKGSRAYLNGVVIQVSNVKRVSCALISTGRPHNYLEHYPQLMNALDYFTQNSHGVRQSGSAATDLAYIACGRFDGRYEFGLKPWDMAAGILIINQAGGKVSDFNANENYFQNGDLIASNGQIHDEISELIRQHFKK